mmetsp:Transcript_14325/g.36596  ORF Transcript_14325/g.36596 Transcript_14325/m.36596 type:complete len:82 (+) Transcript_14325:455-700(+)
MKKRAVARYENIQVCVLGFRSPTLEADIGNRRNEMSLNVVHETYFSMLSPTGRLWYTTATELGKDHSAERSTNLACVEVFF